MHDNSQISIENQNANTDGDRNQVNVQAAASSDYFRASHNLVHHYNWQTTGLTISSDRKTIGSNTSKHSHSGCPNSAGQHLETVVISSKATHAKFKAASILTCMGTMGILMGSSVCTGAIFAEVSTP